ncbi:MAG TPA: methyl-accepting chemotaxis protein [Denitromonas sp.]|uniref:methyl-accepting chemotaxis protein n=1 Tax=Denitromonas sp. TaxID=2734609 RepID=UPI001D5EADEA|nr:methyl-accepting chemotaxis protein [Rhodocyclaceae bacterium]MCP5220479.1 methyl-accepting chemotaxis protein [Zoogloeaceae bacterium]HQU88601.1 methyl-accepting chemotaxis protein [Denitromonas sp.]HQV14873.1 methyl-accepting chemotaxis protein [Denitromonas sp.]
MRVLFTPAVRLLNQLRYTTKFLLIGGTAALASMFLLFQLYTQIQMARDMTSQEQSGLVVLDASIKTLTKMQQHRGTTSGLLGGDTSLAPKIAALAEEVEQAVAEVDAALSGPGADFGLAGPWGEIKNRWAPLKGGTPNERGSNFKAHTQMIEDVLDLIGDIGSQSRLSFDPDADAANLIGALLTSVPEMSERLGRLRGMGTGIIARGVLTLDDEKSIVRQLGQLEVTKDALMDRFRRAARHNPSLEASLKQAGDEIAAAHKDLRDVTQAQIVDQKFDIKPEAFFAVGTQAISSLVGHSNSTLFPNANALLTQRADRLTRSLMIELLVSVGMILIAGYLLVGMYLSIVGSVRELTAGTTQMAQGDYTTRVAFSARDELSDVAHQFNDMAERLAAIIAQVKRSAEDLRAAAGEMAIGSGQVAEGSERQSEAAASMAAAVEQMTVSIDEINRHAQAASTQSADSGRLSKEGGDVVRQSVTEMERIAESVHEVASVIRDLGDKSGKISTIVNVIREIAEQTNLLALNAAIEAARAGETGRGFAVVADEVRKLAERTAKATGEITGMVEAIQTGTQKAVGTMESGVERVQEGVVLTKRAGASMEQINAGAANVVVSVEDISAALREQSAASTDIARNVEAIAQMSEQNSAAVRNSARTAGRLEGLARSLSDEVARFKV